MSDSTITLTAGELSFAGKIGRRRNDEDDAAGLSKGGAFLGLDESGYAQHILGVCGEMAFAKFLGIKYVPPQMKAVDVGGYEVRTASKAGYRLIVRPRDADAKKFVSVVKISDSTFTIQGWITAAEAKEVGESKNPPKGSNAGPAWFVPNNKLHRFGENAEREAPVDLRTTKKPAEEAKWDDVTLENIEWFKKGSKLPPAPFEVRPGSTVVDAEKYMTRLAEDIAHGPSGPRGLLGAIQFDLRDLRKLAGS
jgi:hypothetical protein